jgi:hypothetical protein
MKSRLTRGAWIEIKARIYVKRICPSRLTRGAWIKPFLNRRKGKENKKQREEKEK